MNMNHLKFLFGSWSLAIGSVLILAAAASAQTAAMQRVNTWQRWEHALTSARQYDNPYADVTLRVRYTGPDGRRLDGYGFWDGGQVFRIRCAFPAPGTGSGRPSAPIPVTPGCTAGAAPSKSCRMAARIRSTDAAS